MRSGSWDSATTTGEVWNKTLHRRGRGSERPRRKATLWLPTLYSRTGTPGHPDLRRMIVHFTNAGSTPPRHEVAHEFAGQVHEHFLGVMLQRYNGRLQEVDSAVPHQSMRDSMWVNFMIEFGISDEELELAKRVYAYSLRRLRLLAEDVHVLRLELYLARKVSAVHGASLLHRHRLPAW